MGNYETRHSRSDTLARFAFTMFLVRGPLMVPTDGSSWPNPDLIVTDPRDGLHGSRGYGWTPRDVSHGLPKFYAPGTRPFYEPRPWHESASLRGWFDEYLEALRQYRLSNGLDPSCLEGLTWRDFAPVVS